MLRVALGLVGIFGLLSLVSPDAGLVYGQIAVVMLAAIASTAFIFSMMAGGQREVAMASAGESQQFEADTPVGKFRFLGDSRSFIVFAIAALAYFGYLHHTSNEAALTRLFEAMTENTYVISLPQAEREKLNIAEPESLKRKRRIRERD